MAGALVARRSYPLTACLASSLALSVESLAGLASNASPYANQVAVFSLGLYATRKHARLGPPIVLVAGVVYFAGDPRDPGVGRRRSALRVARHLGGRLHHGPPTRRARTCPPRGPAAGRRRGTNPGGSGASRRGRPHRQPARRPGWRRPAACSTRTRRRHATCLQRWSRPAATRWPTSTTCSHTCATNRPPPTSTRPPASPRSPTWWIASPTPGSA